MGRTSTKQQEIYEFIIAFTEEVGYPPSVREIGKAVELKSPSTVHFHLKALCALGMINQAAGKTRSITINNSGGMQVKRDRVPLVGNVAAGSPILAQECVEEYLVFDTNGMTGEHFALRVRGESMLNAGILPDDVVIVHQQQNVRNGDIVVAQFEDEATVKTYSNRNGAVWLLPENDDYEPIDGTYAEILGKVVAVIRKY